MLQWWEGEGVRGLRDWREKALRVWRGRGSVVADGCERASSRRRTREGRNETLDVPRGPCVVKRRTDGEGREGERMTKTWLEWRMQRGARRRAWWRSAGAVEGGRVMGERERRTDVG
jgi:hypothetical protein